MIEEITRGYNIGWDIVNERKVTTAAIPRSYVFGGYRLAFETIIWEFDGKEFGRIIHMINHRSEKTAEKIHSQIVQSLKEK